MGKFWRCAAVCVQGILPGPVSLYSRVQYERRPGGLAGQTVLTGAETTEYVLD
jgi:hypothetical protein